MYIISASLVMLFCRGACYRGQQGLGPHQRPGEAHDQFLLINMVMLSVYSIIFSFLDAQREGIEPGPWASSVRLSASSTPIPTTYLSLARPPCVYLIVILFSCQYWSRSSTPRSRPSSTVCSTSTLSLTTPRLCLHEHFLVMLESQGPGLGQGLNSAPQDLLHRESHNHALTPDIEYISYCHLIWCTAIAGC